VLQFDLRGVKDGIYEMSAISRQIIALGGGGFSMEPDNLTLDSYILTQAHKKRPRVCLLPTATGDSNRYIANFYAAFTRLDCQPTHLSLFGRTPDLRALISKQDVMYVGGGNTKSMLAVWGEWGLPELLDEAWQNGTILAGVSAGAICWFKQGLTDSWVGRYTILECLGFLKGSCCPHYDGEVERRPAYHDFMLQGEAAAGYAIEEGAALHFTGNELLRVVSSRAGAKAYRVFAEGENVREEVLTAEELPRVAGE
jgi:peptidase E